MTQSLKEVYTYIRSVVPHKFAEEIIVTHGRNVGKSIFRNIYHNNRGIRPPKEIFNHFLRVNNRKKLFVAKDFLDAGYPYVDSNVTKLDDTSMKYDWMIANMKYRYVCIGADIFFANEDDKMMFLIRWMR